MADFCLSIHTNVYFGNECLNNLSTISKGQDNILIVYGNNSAKSNGAYYDVVSFLHGKRIYELPGVMPNPDISFVRKGVSICQRKKISCIIAIGGGSVIDCAKLISASIHYAGDVWDIVKNNIQTTTIPLIAVLTIPGSGSETNSEAVISNYETREKLVYSNDSIMPKYALIAPKYFKTLSIKQLSIAIADSISHVFEAFFVKNPFEVNDYLISGIIKCLIDIPNTFSVKKNEGDLEKIIWSSNIADNGLLFCGNNSLTFPVHAIEHEISAINKDVIHGEGMAILMPAWLNYIYSKGCYKRIARFGELVFGINGNDDIQVSKQTIDLFNNFINSLGLKKKLSEILICETMLSEISKQVVRNNDLSDVFPELDEKEIFSILIKCI